MAAGRSKRLTDTSDDGIVNNKLRLNSENTIKSNQKCANIRREYLLEKQQTVWLNTKLTL